MDRRGVQSGDSADMSCCWMRRVVQMRVHMLREHWSERRTDSSEGVSNQDLIMEIIARPQLASNERLSSTFLSRRGGCTGGLPAITPSEAIRAELVSCQLPTPAGRGPFTLPKVISLAVPPLPLPGRRSHDTTVQLCKKCF